MFLTCLVGSLCGGVERGMEVLLYRGYQMSIADEGMTQGVREAVGAGAGNGPSENRKGSQQ